MMIRMCRIFNVCRRAFLGECLVLGGIFLLLPLLILYLLDGFYPVFVVAIVGMNLIGAFVRLLGYPSKAEFRDGVLTYTENYEISKGERRRLHFRITEIRQVELIQNKFEKRFNIGRIRFRGTAEIEPIAPLKGRTIVFFELCGIRDFQAVSKRLMEQCD